MQILRIERNRRMQGSITFLQTDIPGVGDDSNRKGSAVTPYLSLIRGSRNTTVLQNGRVQETFTVIGGRWGNRGNILKEVATLTQYFEEATLLEKAGDMINVYTLVEQLEDESQRRAVIYSGTISPIDDSVVDRQLSTGYALYVVTVERAARWEYGGALSIISGSPTGSYPGALGVIMGGEGGTHVLPSDYGGLGSIGRCALFAVTPLQSYLKKMWIGIKPNRGGDDYFEHNLNTFDPTIKVTSQSPTLGRVHILDLRKNIVSNPEANDGTCVRIEYIDQYTWKQRFRCRMVDWNSGTLNENDRRRYAGTYHLIGRIMVTGDRDAILGLRIGTGYENPSAISWGNRHWLPAVTDGYGTAQWRYIDLGTISIGGGLIDLEFSSRLVLDQFSIYVESMWAQGSDKANMLIDDFHLVPAEHFLHFNLDNEINPNRRVEIFTNQKDVVHGYVVENKGYDPVNDFLPINIYNRKIYSSISEIENNNWGVPWEPGSALVVVTDRKDAESYYVDANIAVLIAARKRTESVVYVNE